MESRSCENCTGCCDGWVKISVKGYEAQPGTPCPFSTGKGCADYENRPNNPCRQFNCGWVVNGSPLPEWMKPSEAKIIVIFDKFRYQGVPVDLAIPTGRKIPQRSLEWMKKFAASSRRPLLFFENEKIKGKYTGESILNVHGPQEFRQYIENRINRGLTAW